ncbi:hypothetical protein CJ483_21985 [Bacillus sp. PK3_68]|nr:hypothetical protein CJ483_21985 [Bacillus sp. PK3_68]
MFLYGGIQMLYEDRKMLKWQGFMLSEHTEQLQETKPVVKEIAIDEQQKEVFDRVLRYAYNQQLPVTVHLNTFGYPYMEVTGVIQSFHHKPNHLKVLGKGVICTKDIVAVDFANKKDEGDGY